MDWRRHGYTKKSLSAAFFTFQRSGFLCETLHGRDHFTGEAPAMNGGSPPYARHANFKVSWNKKHQQKGEMRMAGSGYNDCMYKNARGSFWKFGSRIRSFWGILPKKTSIKGPLVFFFHVGDFAASFLPGFLPVAPRKSSKMRPGSKGRGNQWDGKSIGFLSGRRWRSLINEGGNVGWLAINVVI